jgi:type VI secretion system protein ImpF
VAKGADHEIRVVPSFLDRLIDLEPKNQRDPPASRSETVRDFRLAVQRDLDDLLNSRNTFADLSPDFAEAGQSVLTYGLPDFSAFAIANARDQNRLRQVIETTIRTFEPRLTGITVTLTPSIPGDRTMRLHVDARLVIDPTPEPIGFDIVMPLHASKLEVKERA